MESNKVNAALVHTMASMPTEPSDGASELPKHAAPDVIEAEANESKQPPDSKSVESSWEIIQRWRQNQTSQDWKMSEQVRYHISLLLKDSLVRNPDGSHKTKLKAHELRHISLSVGDIQKVQRLALGLSTDNIGVEGKIENNVVEIQSGGGENKNVFVCQLSKNGKFLNARPRKVNA